MTYTYTPKGVCARRIRFALEDGIVHNVVVEGGCHGNSQGVAALAEGMPADDLLARLSGIRCGFKQTSCPDQLSRAVKEALETE